MNSNERFVTGPDNQWSWPLLEPASVHFGPGDLASVRVREAENRLWIEGRLPSGAKNTKAPIVSRGFGEVFRSGRRLSSQR
jgi:hypothetical protein